MCGLTFELRGWPKASPLERMVRRLLEGRSDGLPASSREVSGADVRGTPRVDTVAVGGIRDAFAFAPKRLRPHDNKDGTTRGYVSNEFKNTRATWEAKGRIEFRTGPRRQLHCRNLVGDDFRAKLGDEVSEPRRPPIAQACGRVCMQTGQRPTISRELVISGRSRRIETRVRQK